MKIQQSVIEMTGNSSVLETHSRKESLKTWVENQWTGVEKTDPISQSLPNLKADSVQISEEAKKFLSMHQSSVKNAEENFSELVVSDRETQKLLALQKMIELLTGKRIKLLIPEKIKLEREVLNLKLPPPQSSQLQQREGWGLEYDYHELNLEQQRMSFSSQGTVQTSDGKKINFSIDLKMSRDFMSCTDMSVRAGDAIRKDPLVIHFDSPSSQLTDTKYSFDLDCDGESDQISFVAPGSGFLALDMNNDGKINDGSELFGPKSGDGFADLATYDKDGNRWIDENDPIYEKLRIWTKDEKGNDTLFALGQKGIGAIYLGNVATDFALKDPENNLQGEIRKTGIFLRENGTAGIMQHIDLAL